MVWQVGDHRVAGCPDQCPSKSLRSLVVQNGSIKDYRAIQHTCQPFELVSKSADQRQFWTWQDDIDSDYPPMSLRKSSPET